MKVKGRGHRCLEFRNKFVVVASKPSKVHYKGSYLLNNGARNLGVAGS